jgi:L-iditol 2-dehydrogenase
MKVISLHGVEDLRMHDAPDPIPGQDKVLLRVTAVGICGSDLHWYEEGGIGESTLTEPLVLGHEFAGVIESGPRQGERVAVDPAIPCNRCEYCLEGNPNFCADLYFAGQGTEDGALAEWMAWPERCLFRLPDSLTGVDGAMLEPLGVAIHAVDLGKIKPGMAIGVFGCGPIGLLALQMARVAGATRLFATDKLPYRLDAARELGATDVFLAEAGQEARAILAATGGRGVDVAFEAAGENAAVEAAMAAALSAYWRFRWRGWPAQRAFLPSTNFPIAWMPPASWGRRTFFWPKRARRRRQSWPQPVGAGSMWLLKRRAKMPPLKRPWLRPNVGRVLSLSASRQITGPVLAPPSPGAKD